ncbi:MAG: condensation domain-containing protein, partial [Cyclobacteriaceae bacterium]
EYVAARDEMESRLVEIWERVLQREQIGVFDDFFALGGHSLKALKLSNEFQKVFQVKVSLQELFLHTNIAAQGLLISSSEEEAFVQIEKIAIQDHYAISDSQRRLWVLSQFEGGSVAYNMPLTMTLTGEYNIPDFSRAIISTIERHEILRTVFKVDEQGEIRQWILNKEQLGFQLDYQDFREAVNPKEAVDQYLTKDAYKAFDLENGPLLRAAMLQIADEEYVFYFNMHHIISDGWSIEVLTRDVSAYYEAYRTGNEPALPELRIQFKDYASWQLEQLSGETFDIQRTWWLKQLAGELPVLDLPGSKKRPAIKTYSGRSMSTYMDKDITLRLNEYALSNGGSLFMSLLASWNVLMYRYTSQTDIIIGSPVSGREHSDLGDQIGFYVNSLSLRNEINPIKSFKEIFEAVKTNTLEAFAHQMYPFDRLVEELGLEHNKSRSAVFDIMLTVQNNGEGVATFELSDEEVGTIIQDADETTSKFDINVTFKEESGYLLFHVAYNPDVYEADMVEGMMRHFRSMIDEMLNDPEKPISEINYLSEGEKEELLSVFNETASAYPLEKTVTELFEEQVKATPDHVAVVFGDTSLTYQQLDAKANQLAHYLVEKYDIQPEDLVSIKQDRGIGMIVSI